MLPNATAGAVNPRRLTIPGEILINYANGKIIDKINIAPPGEPQSWVRAFLA